MFFKGK